MVAPSNIGMKFRGKKSAQMLCEKTDPSPINQARPPAYSVIRSRLAPGFSTRRDTVDSSMEIDVLRAANKTSSKNNVPTISPPGIWPSATGRVTNKRPGPAAGSSAKANTIGKMASPASISTDTLAPAIAKADLGMEACLSR